MYRGERFNSITHLLGAMLSIAGLAVLVVVALPSDQSPCRGYAQHAATLPTLRDLQGFHVFGLGVCQWVIQGLIAQLCLGKSSRERPYPKYSKI